MSTCSGVHDNDYLFFLDVSASSSKSPLSMTMYRSTRHARLLITRDSRQLVQHTDSVVDFRAKTLIVRSAMSAAARSAEHLTV